MYLVKQINYIYIFLNQYLYLKYIKLLAVLITILIWNKITSNSI